MLIIITTKKIDINSDDNHSLQKTLKVQNVIILIRLIFSNYLYHPDLCLVKCWYKLAEQM